MTIVQGQIQPLKKLKEVLNQNGVTRFRSIGEIDRFIKTYESEKQEIPGHVESSVDAEIEEMQSALIACRQIYDDLRSKSLNGLHLKLRSLEVEQKQVLEKAGRNLLWRTICYPKTLYLSFRTSYLGNNLERIVKKKTRTAAKRVSEKNSTLESFLENKTKTISDRCEESYKELAATKEVVDGLYSVIAGAIGENSVVNELQKLSDNYYVFNDFSVDFDPPIYSKKENDRIFSIQIDHLLVCQSGIFVLETKNWSKHSIKNMDLRSPVKQIRRTGYALFVLLNSDSDFPDIELEHHHWADKKIPIKNIIVMTNAKPKEEFKHVKVFSLSELNGYIQYFDPIFSSKEVESIFRYLAKEGNRNS